MLKIIADLFKLNINLLGQGYHQALKYINDIIPLDYLSFPTGMRIETWEVPEEWVVKDAWVKFNGEKIIDYQKDPLSLMVYSTPFQGKMNRDEFLKHLFTSETKRDAFEYNFNFYKRDWAFSMPFNKARKYKYDKENNNVGKEDILPEGEYEVFIDSEFKDGNVMVGIHTIKGKSDKEILLFAHLDHPYQANDNLSGVACLIDLAKQLRMKDSFDHTIKIIFCPETIGSILYACTQDISKVDFMIAVDAIGNDNTLLMQKSFNKYHKINTCGHLALHELGISYRKGDFRVSIGSDEYVFNDPKINIQGLLVTRYPYDEYHTSDDTPDKIKIDKIEEVQKWLLKTIEIYEKDYIPVRNFKAPLMRSKYGLQTKHKLINLDLDYLWYDSDGVKPLSEICYPLGISFDYAYKAFKTLEENNIIKRKDVKHSGVDNRQRRKPKVAKQK
jgi:aminopeptidase-like protein